MVAPAVLGKVLLQAASVGTSIQYITYLVGMWRTREERERGRLLRR